MPLSSSAINATAAAVLAGLDRRQSLPLITSGNPALSIAESYQISRAVTARRVARGEKVIGRKIGFTNRTIWDEYGVHHPIDGPMYDSTVTFVHGAYAGFGLERFLEPRIEPELVLGLRSAPKAGMTEAELMACVGWIAHGFEIVQSLFPSWRFKGADCIAAFGLHGALICGPRRIVQDSERTSVQTALRQFTIGLSLNGDVIDRGKAANVLDGPVLALGHLVEAIAKDRDATPLAAGDIITTGTLTRAFPIVPGQRWTTELAGLDLPGMDVSFSV